MMKRMYSYVLAIVLLLAFLTSTSTSFANTPAAMAAYSQAIDQWFKQPHVANHPAFSSHRDIIKSKLANAHENPKKYQELVSEYENLLKTLDSTFPNTLDPKFLEASRHYSISLKSGL